MKVGRNKPCPCGSGAKFKRCHGRAHRHAFSEQSNQSQILDRFRAQERVRQNQQGAGKPIISVKMKDHQVVAVGNTLHWSTRWKTFPDFLNDYLKRKVGSEWGNAEIAKPLEQRHPLMQWYDALCRYQAKVILRPGEVTSSEVTGVVACYLGVAYGLYLLDHNVELQDRLLKRLRDPGNFQGAYYELLVARALIQSGFELTLEDETDTTTKHCEFAAVSKQTGRRYWVEAKMRAIAGQLGRTTADGTSSRDDLSSFVKQLNAAFRKPAADDRMIFIDLNAELPSACDEHHPPEFMTRAAKRLESYERRDLKAGDRAYVFVTSTSFHRELDAPARLIAYPFGLGMPDFNRPGTYRLSEAYRRELVHGDALRVGLSLTKLASFPTTFDGSLPGVSLYGERPPLVIGQTYNFEGAGEDGGDIEGIVRDAIVLEHERSVMVAIDGADGISRLLKEPMTEHQFGDYRAHPDAYFGKVVRPSTKVETPLDLFKFFMHAFEALSREELLSRFGGRVEGAEAMQREELLAIYCEGMVSASGFKFENEASAAVSD